MPKQTLTINITQEDIREGRPCASSSCPMALALVNKFNENNPDKFFRATVVSSWWQVEMLPSSEPIAVGPMSKVASDFIDKFDGHKAVKPKTMKLYIDPKYREKVQKYVS